MTKTITGTVRQLSRHPKTFGPSAYYEIVIQVSAIETVSLYLDGNPGFAFEQRVKITIETIEE